VKYFRDLFFASSVSQLYKTKNKLHLKAKIRNLEEYVLEQDSITLAFRLAIELDDLGFHSRKLQSYIINIQNPKYIFRYAREIKKANIKALEEATISCGSIIDIARFGAFIRGSNKTRIEDLIAVSSSAKAAYLYIRYVRYCNVRKLKHIILQSGRPRYLYALARITKNKKELKNIEDLITHSNSSLYIRLYAMRFKNVDLQKLEDRIIELGNYDEMSKFGRILNSPRLSKMLSLF
jgi:hypothetical protein